MVLGVAAVPAVRGSPFSSRQNESPSVSGSPMSRTTRSGSRAPSDARASAALSASSTESSIASSVVRSSVRRPASSSTTSTRVPSPASRGRAPVAGGVTTRFLPPRLAAYRASSARARRRAFERPSAGETATPAETVGNGRGLRCSRAASSKRSTTCDTAFSPSISRANSSPPNRYTSSSARRVRCTTRANAHSTASPA